MAEKLKIAILGGGPGSMIGPVHRAAMRITDKFEVVAGVFSSDFEKSLDLAQLLGIPRENVFSDYKTLAESSHALRLDAVAILTPNNLHIEAAKAFAEQGVHIICEKPLSSNWDGVDQLDQLVANNNLVFALTHTYSGYPVVRKARDLVASGKLGDVRMVSVEYLQGWLAELLEQDPTNRGAVWREDPTSGGAGGVLGDIGTHAFQLVEFVTGLKVESLLANVSSSPGRAVPDDAMVLLKLNNGASGNLWCSQVAVGCLNGLKIRVFGQKGSLEWSHTNIEQMRVFDADNTETIYHKGQSGEGTLPPGHPEGYYEGFAQLYDDFASQIRERERASRLLLPGLETGKRGLKFIDASLNSSAQNGVWVDIK